MLKHNTSPVAKTRILLKVSYIKSKRKAMRQELMQSEEKSRPQKISLESFAGTYAILTI